MTATARPNAWAAAASATAKLTYSPTVNPAPLTVSVHDRAATLGSLVVVIGNDSGADVEVSSIAFVAQVGKQPGAGGNPPLMAKPPTELSTSEAGRWEFTPGAAPSGGEGPMEFTLTPLPGMGKLKEGESVLVELVDFPTVEAAGSSTVKIVEKLGGAPGQASLAIPTLPAGFFFDSLVATVEEESGHVPVSEVARGGKVVLLWSTSAALGKQKVTYSNAPEGKKAESPAESGRWESPELTADTVFVVSVEEPGEGGEALPAALTTAVTVTDPALVAHSLVADTIEATETLAVRKTLEVTGTLEAAQAKVSGEAELNDVKVEQLTVGKSATVRGTLKTKNLVANQGAVDIIGTKEVLESGVYLAEVYGFIRMQRGQGPALRWELVFPGVRLVVLPPALGPAEWMPIGVGRPKKIGENDDLDPDDPLVEQWRIERNPPAEEKP